MGALGAGAFHASPQRPNIVLVMVDDMGRDWVSCYGAAHRTPHIDRFAEQGVRFENAYSTPICTPTRVELLTGRYPFRTGWTDHHDVPRWGGKGLDWEREITFARLLKRVGYATAIGGKWQVNDFRKYADALQQHGFDEHCMWTGFETGNPPSGERYWNAYLQINGERRTHKGKYGPDLVNEFLIDFIRRHRDGPFLVYYPMVLVHGPFTPTPANRGNPPKEDRVLYAGMVAYMDELFGRLVRCVDDQGIASRTLIVFTADNGSPVAAGSIRGMLCPPGKGKITDLGSHVPFIVRAPWLAPGGRVTQDLLDFTDVLPTLVEVAGSSPPEGVKLDGRSFTGSLTGRGKGRRWIYSQRGKARTLRNHRFKLNGSGAFFDLINDPLERHDLRTSAKPDVAAARERLQRVLDNLPPDSPPPFSEYRPRPTQ